jgi:hypothetical protein
MQCNIRLLCCVQPLFMHGSLSRSTSLVVVVCSHLLPESWFSLTHFRAHSHTMRLHSSVSTVRILSPPGNLPAAGYKTILVTRFLLSMNLYKRFLVLSLFMHACITLYQKDSLSLRSGCECMFSCICLQTSLNFSTRIHRMMRSPFCLFTSREVGEESPDRREEGVHLRIDNLLSYRHARSFRDIHQQ